MSGPVVRTDIVEVYVFHRAEPGLRRVRFLQLQRKSGQLPGTWQPVMGRIEEGESAAGAALRELREETAFNPGDLLGFWQLEDPNAYFLHAAEAMMLSPCFAVEVPSGAEPRPDDSHSGHRWVPRERADRKFLWPGQRRAVAAIMRDILEPESPTEPILRIDPQQM